MFQLSSLFFGHKERKMCLFNDLLHLLVFVIRLSAAFIVLRFDLIADEIWRTYPSGSLPAGGGVATLT